MTRIILKDFHFDEQLESNDSTLLIIKNKKYLYRFLLDIQLSYSEKEYLVIIDDNAKTLKNSDYFDVITYYFDLDINNKRNINALLRLIKYENKDKLREFTESFRSELSMLYRLIAIESELQIQSNIQMSEDDLLKMLNLTIVDEETNLLPRIITYIKAAYELRGIRMFVFAGLHNYLEEYEVFQLLHEAKLLNIKIINIESNHFMKEKYDKVTILDNDICVID